ncbi:MAG: glycosyltransferase family 2 protein, partial [Methanomassiliicoccales archaeon]|nr:glycosyltransferase family 2 protein [Methanomassiliicoccales archaeon]
MAVEAVQVLDELDRDYEIIIVDDGSTDDTPGEIARATSEFKSIKAVTLTENQGKGNALRRGFEACKNGLVLFLDADLDLHPLNIRVLLAEMEKTGADIIIGSKRHPDSRLNYPWHRRLYSSIYYLLVLILFRLPIKDTQTGVKVFRREVLTRSFPRLVCKRYTLDLELLAVTHSMGYSVSEAPIKLTFQRDFGRIKLADVRNIIVDTLAIFYRLY